MKIAVQDEDGKLLLFTNPERFTETWADGKCRISADLKSDDSGIVLNAHGKTTAKLLAQYFGVPLDRPARRTMTQSEFLRAVDRGEWIGPDPIVTLDPLPEMTTADRVRELCRNCGLRPLPWQVDFLANNLDASREDES